MVLIHIALSQRQCLCIDWYGRTGVLSQALVSFLVTINGNKHVLVIVIET